MAGILRQNSSWKTRDFFVGGLWLKDFPMAMQKLSQIAALSTDTFSPSLLLWGHSCFAACWLASLCISRHTSMPPRESLAHLIPPWSLLLGEPGPAHPSISWQLRGAALHLPQAPTGTGWDGRHRFRENCRDMAKFTKQICVGRSAGRVVLDGE